MALQIGDVVEYDFPETIHECGPQSPACIDDALSRSRGYYLKGYSIFWIHSSYRKQLQELIDQKVWRSADAAQFAVILDQAYARAMMLRVTVAVPA